MKVVRFRFRRPTKEDVKRHIQYAKEGLKEAAVVGAGSAVGIVAVFAGLHALNQRFDLAMDISTLFTAVKDAQAVLRESASESLITTLPVLAVNKVTIFAVWVLGMVGAFASAYKRAMEERGWRRPKASPAPPTSQG